jgi:hypothetical protein
MPSFYPTTVPEWIKDEVFCQELTPQPDAVIERGVG